MKSDRSLRVNRLLTIVAGLEEIPANEQHLGHFMQATQKALALIADELASINDELKADEQRRERVCDALENFKSGIERLAEGRR